MVETVSQSDIENIARSTRDITKGQEFADSSARANENPKEFPRDFLKFCAPFGYLGMDIPEIYGGNEIPTQYQTAIMEEFNRAHAGLGLSVLVANSLTAFPIAKFGTEQQKQKYLPKMASGEIFGCFAITEPNIGSDAKAIEMKAIPDGDGFRIRGSKRFITNANGADICVFDARTGTPESRENGISTFVLEIKNIPQISVPTVYNKVGQPGSALCEVVFDDLFVPDSDLMGELNNGFNTVIAGTLAHSRVQIAAQGVGIAQSALDEAEKYSQNRKQFGKFLYEIPYWANHFQILKRQVELSRFLTQKAARHEDANDPNFFVWASLAKLIAGETAIRVSEDAMLLHGGMGYTKDMRIGQIVKDSLVVRIYEGTAHIQMRIIEKNLADGRRRANSLFPPKTMLSTRLKDLLPLDKVKEKVEHWKMKTH